LALQADQQPGRFLEAVYGERFPRGGNGKNQGHPDQGDDDYQLHQGKTLIF